MENQEIGATKALIKAIRTNSMDGSVSVTLDMLPQDETIVQKLMSKFMHNKKVVMVAFVDCDE